jgi:lipopolysaccharide transport system permease protein/teichoic acid transport system permease protein
MYKIFTSFYRFLKDIYNSKDLIVALAKNDFKEQFLGSHLGLLWAILRPSLFMLIVWFIFSIGFKHSVSSSGVPFVLYLMCGYIPWFFFSDSVSGGMNSIVNNKFLVKKVNFRVSILPIVKILSVLFLHLIFIGILIVVFLFYGYKPTIYWLQLPFYTFMMILLVLGISWLVSALRVFTKDVAQIVSVILQLGFWVTPIFWSIDKVPDKYLYILKLNPMVFIVEGYRNSFINGIWFWETYKYTPYFIGITLFFLVVGAVVFRKLRPHFGDVL